MVRFCQMSNSNHFVPLIVPTGIPTEAVAMGRAIEEHEREAAKERQRVAGIANLPTVSSGKLPELTGTGDTRDKVGAALGTAGNFTKMHGWRRYG